MASEWPLCPKTSHFRSPVCSSHVLTPHNASMNDSEAGLGLHQLGDWHCQCNSGLRKASPPQTPPISTSSMLLLRADATQCFPERPWGWVGAASARGKGKGKGYTAISASEGSWAIAKTKKRQLQEEKEARLNKTPEKETRSVIKQSKAFVRKVSYSYGIRLIGEVSQASSATCWYGIKQVLELIAQADQLSIRAIQNSVCFILDIIKSTSVTDSLFIRDSLIVTLNLHLKLVTRKT